MGEVTELTGLPRIIADGLINLVGDGMYSGNRTALFLCGLLSIVVAYLLGSINFAVIFSKTIYRDDVRLHGSGNAGSTNMLRTYGLLGGLLTFACDFLKSAIATAIGLLFMPWRTGFAFVCGAVCLLGHAYPIFFGFHGGKCVASLSGVVFVINPPAWILLMILFVLVVALTRYISLGSLIASGLLPICNAIMPFWFSPSPPAALFSTVLMAALVFFLHRGNIKRLVDGNEAKFTLHKKNG